MIRFLTHQEMKCRCSYQHHTQSIELFCSKEIIRVAESHFKKRVLIFAPSEFPYLPLPQDEASNSRAYDITTWGRVLRRKDEYICRFAVNPEDPNSPVLLPLGYNFSYLEQELLGTLPPPGFFEKRSIFTRLVSSFFFFTFLIWVPYFPLQTRPF